MMGDGDWHDPFAEDEAAAERERRRVEREARRRERRATVAGKVAEERGEQQPPATEESATAQQPRPVQTPPTRQPRASGLRGDNLLQRRAIGLVALAAMLGLIAVGVIAVADRLGGDEEPAAPAQEAKVSELTVPEGLDRTQIAAVAKEAGLRGDYERESRGFAGFDPGKYEAGDPPSLEGFLFPATYELPRKATVEDLISRQLDAFEANLRQVDLSYARSKNLNEYDVLKIASMVEREIQVPEERRLAAAVIYNRLADGSPLGIDATIRYEDQNYDEQLTQSRLDEDTPYNTRTNAGLPPTPIGNPGLASIKAAANPARSDAFYFVIKPGTCGEHVFVETEQEFAQAEAEYQAALEAEGGSPTEC